MPGLDEGGDATAEQVDQARTAWLLLEPDAQGWVASQASKAGNLSLDQLASMRRCHLGLALVSLASSGGTEPGFLGACCAEADAPVDLSVCDADAAERLYSIVERLALDEFTISVSNDGTMRLQAVQANSNTQRKAS